MRGQVLVGAALGLGLYLLLEPSRPRRNGPVAAAAEWTLRSSKEALAEARDCLDRGDKGCARRRAREAMGLASEVRAASQHVWVGGRGLFNKAERAYNAANDLLWSTR
jgi:hypothetical protein